MRSAASNSSVHQPAIVGPAHDPARLALPLDLANHQRFRSFWRGNFLSLQQLRGRPRAAGGESGNNNRFAAGFVQRCRLLIWQALVPKGLVVFPGRARAGRSLLSVTKATTGESANARQLMPHTTHAVKAASITCPHNLPLAFTGQLMLANFRMGVIRNCHNVEVMANQRFPPGHSGNSARNSGRPRGAR